MVWPSYIGACVIFNLPPYTLPQSRILITQYSKLWLCISECPGKISHVPITFCCGFCPCFIVMICILGWILISCKVWRQWLSHSIYYYIQYCWLSIALPLVVIYHRCNAVWLSLPPALFSCLTLSDKSYVWRNNWLFAISFFSLMLFLSCFCEMNADIWMVFPTVVSYAHFLYYCDSMTLPWNLMIKCFVLRVSSRDCLSMLYSWNLVVSSCEWVLSHAAISHSQREQKWGLSAINNLSVKLRCIIDYLYALIVEPCAPVENTVYLWYQLVVWLTVWTGALICSCSQCLLWW